MLIIAIVIQDLIILLKCYNVTLKRKRGRALFYHLRYRISNIFFYLNIYIFLFKYILTSMLYILTSLLLSLL